VNIDWLVANGYEWWREAPTSDASKRRVDLIARHSGGTRMLIECKYQRVTPRRIISAVNQINAYHAEYPEADALKVIATPRGHIRPLMELACAASGVILLPLAIEITPDPNNVSRYVARFDDGSVQPPRFIERDMYYCWNSCALPQERTFV